MISSKRSTYKVKSTYLRQTLSSMSGRSVEKKERYKYLLYIFIVTSLVLYSSIFTDLILYVMSNSS